MRKSTQKLTLTRETLRALATIRQIAGGDTDACTATNCQVATCHGPACLGTLRNCPP